MTPAERSAHRALRDRRAKDTFDGVSEEEAATQSTAHWRQAHLWADRQPFFTISEPERPFWIPEWTVRKLLAGRKAR